MQEALQLVHNTLVGVGQRNRFKLGASGKIVIAFDLMRTLALGTDQCNSARGFMSLCSRSAAFSRKSETQNVA